MIFYFLAFSSVENVGGSHALQCSVLRGQKIDIESLKEQNKRHREKEKKERDRKRVTR